MNTTECERQHDALEVLRKMLADPRLMALPGDLLQRVNELDATRKVAVATVETAWDEAEKKEEAERCDVEEARDYRASVAPPWFI
jgi:hypothetical protein